MDPQFRHSLVKKCTFVVDAVYDGMAEAKEKNKAGVCWQLVRVAVAKARSDPSPIHVILVANSDHPKHLAVLVEPWETAVSDSMLCYTARDLVELAARPNMVAPSSNVEFADAKLVIDFPKPPCFWADATTFRRLVPMKQAVNDPCQCKSGKKFKKCCMNK